MELDMRTFVRLVRLARSFVTAASLGAIAASPLVAQRDAGDASPAAAHRQRVSAGPFVGSGPGAALLGPNVPTVGLAVDSRLAGVGPLRLHLGGTVEHRAGALMTGLVASLALPLDRHAALRVGPGLGAAQASAGGGNAGDALRWHDWYGVDVGLEVRLGRTTGALALRSGTVRGFGACAGRVECADLPRASGGTRFTRIAIESRYALF